MSCQLLWQGYFSGASDLSVSWYSLQEFHRQKKPSIRWQSRFTYIMSCQNVYYKYFHYFIIWIMVYVKIYRLLIDIQTIVVSVPVQWGCFAGSHHSQRNFQQSLTDIYGFAIDNHWELNNIQKSSHSHKTGNLATYITVNLNIWEWAL